MTTFRARNVSEADLPVDRWTMWDVLRDPATLAELTPMIRAITVDGDHWCWQLRGVSALGVTVEPSFTERMSFTDGERIEFRHDPPTGTTERGGADGVYTLADAPDGVHLHIDLELCVDLPLPALSRRAVERVMRAAMARTGDQFAANLYARLGIDPAQATMRTIVG